jgi:hypothetical protein
VGPRVLVDALEKETLSFLLRTSHRVLDHPVRSLIPTIDALSSEMWLTNQRAYITFLCIKLVETKLGRSR